MHGSLPRLHTLRSVQYTTYNRPIYKKCIIQLWITIIDNRACFAQTG